MLLIQLVILHICDVNFQNNNLFKFNKSNANLLFTESPI